MYSSGIYFKIVVLNTILFFSSVVRGQENVEDGIEDEFSFFSAGLDYSTNSDVNGRFSMFGSQPTLNSLVSYYHKSGFDISAIYTNVWNSDETNKHSTQELGLSLGYNIDFTEWLSSSASYSHYYYSVNSHSLKSVYKHLVSAGLYSNVDWWMTDIMAGYYSGKVNELFVGIETGGSIDFENVFKKGNTLSIQGMISAYMGDINYYNTDAYQNYTYLYTFAEHFPEVTAGQFLYKISNPVTTREIVLSELINKRPQRIEKLKDLPENMVLWDLFKEQKTYDFNNIGFTIPIYYYMNNFMINLGFSAFRPVNQPEYVDAAWTGYTNVGITYFILW